MIRDITIGQYYPADSILHLLDPQSEADWNIVYLLYRYFYLNHSMGNIPVILCLVGVVNTVPKSLSFSFLKE